MAHCPSRSPESLCNLLDGGVLSSPTLSAWSSTASFAVARSTIRMSRSRWLYQAADPTYEPSPGADGQDVKSPAGGGRSQAFVEAYEIASPCS
jgi:hypothetical protein